PGFLGLGLSLNGAYLAEKYPGPAWLAALSARNVGNTWPVARSGSFSIATTLPIFGAMLPSAAAGFRPICTQVWDSEWTSAHARTERTTAMLGSWPAIFSSNPTGHETPLIVSGFSEAGVSGDCLKSNVSLWLGAPVSRMKMTFLALFSVVTGELVMSAAEARLGRSNIEPVTPPPRSWKNCRRELCGRWKNGTCGCGYRLAKRLNRSWLFMLVLGLVIEHEIHFV